MIYILNLKNKFLKIKPLKDHLHLIIAFVVLVSITAYSSYSTGSRDQNSSAQTTLEVDTVIPKGYVLVPLQLENLAAISAVIQSFGIIDLYTSSPDGLKAKKVASRIKLIRAPYNPNLFAALVKENLSELIMKQTGPFFAVIQNKASPEGLNTTDDQVQFKKISIEYQK